MMDGLAVATDNGKPKLDRGTRFPTDSVEGETRSITDPEGATLSDFTVSSLGGPILDLSATHPFSEVFAHYCRNFNSNSLLFLSRNRGLSNGRLGTLIRCNRCCPEVHSRGGQIIHSSCGPRPQCIADEDQCGHGAARTAKVPKRGKCVKNVDNTEKTQTI